MSSDLYEVLSLAARYLFTLLGVLIVLRSFLWLFSDRTERHRRLRRLPDAGFVGEMVVLSDTPDLPMGSIIPVPWEGVLGSVRSSDICLPCSGVRKNHLFFSFQPGLGMSIHPFSGCEARVNGTLLNCHSREGEAPLGHGAFLQVGSAQLRLRLFSGLDPQAGFEENAAPVPEKPSFFPDPDAAQDDSFLPQELPVFQDPPSAYPIPPASPETDPGTLDAGLFSAEDQPDTSLNDSVQDSSSSRRRRRSDRWEADWSE